MTLSEYLLAYLGKLNDELGYTESDLTIVIADTLASYGVSSESDATDLRKLYCLAKVELWKKIMVDVSQDFNFSADGASYSRSQFFDMAEKNYEIAVGDAVAYSPNYKVQVGKKTRHNHDEFGVRCYHAPYHR